MSKSQGEKKSPLILQAVFASEQAPVMLVRDAAIRSVEELFCHQL